MKPAPFDYIGAESVDEALAALAELGDDARVLAGGQTLIPMLNMRIVEPRVVIDVSRIVALNYIRREGGTLEVGAAATQASLERWSELTLHAPLLARALPHVGHFQTRNKGTVCGSLAFADPSAELPLCLATLGGEVLLRSKRGERRISAGDFQRGMLSTARAADEMIVAARFPTREAGAGYAFREVALRHGDFAITAIAAIARENGIRIGVGGVGDRPEVRDWPDLANDALDDALNELAWQLGGADDLHADARYRRELVRRIGRRTIEEAKLCRA